MKNVTTTGTVKVGRWSYPAEQDAQGTIRNTKRDGSGEWVKADAAAFVPEPTKAAAAKLEVETDLTVPSDDYNNLEAVHLAVFNSGIWADHTDIQVNGLTEKRALELVRHLRKLNLVVEEQSTDGDGFDTGKPIWSSSPNWDEVTEAESLALFAAAVPTDVKVTERKIGTGAVVNNTHKKPGRSTWAVGTACPQGHTLAAEDIYTMPSGRRQCRQCRGSYASAI